MVQPRSEQSTRSRAKRPLFFVAVSAAVLFPLVVAAHERWVPHSLIAPFDHSYFRSLSGERLFFTMGIVTACAAAIICWYLLALPLSAWLAAKRTRARNALLFLVDGDFDGPVMKTGRVISSIIFYYIPAFILSLGAVQGWILLPSYPVHGTMGDVLLLLEAGLAVLVALGRYRRLLAMALLSVWIYVWADYGIAAIDEVILLASVVYYWYADQRRQVMSTNDAQLFGLRTALGIGFILLGVVNKVYIAELFIGVGQHYPSLLSEVQVMMPRITIEGWSFAIALGEMAFGLMLLLGIFGRIITVALTFLFIQRIFFFGLSEIVHLYPVAGFAVLFFHDRQRTLLDGTIATVSADLHRLLRQKRSAVVHALAVVGVAVSVAWIGIFLPILLVTEILPR